MPKLTTAFQRVTERAALPAQESDRAVVTGADIQLAIYPKRKVPWHALSVNKELSVRPCYRS
jgi:hypothetical protein